MIGIIRNISLKAKLLGYSGILLTLLCLSCGYAIYALNSIGNELNNIIEDDMPLIENVGHITVTHLEQAILFERIVHYGFSLAWAEQRSETIDNQISKKYQLNLAEFKQANQRIVKYFDAAQKIQKQAMVLSDTDIVAKMRAVGQSLKLIEAAHKEYYDQAQEIFTLFNKGELDDALIKIAKIQKEETALDKETSALLFNIQKFTEKTAITIYEHEKTAIVTLLIIVISSVIFALCVSVLISSYIVQGINAAINTASGDLSSVIQVVSKDEIGTLLKTTNGMKERLLAMIQDITSITANLNRVCTQMNTSTQDTGKIISNQRNETELVAVAMQEMTTTTRSVSQDITHTATYALKANELTSKGNVVVHTTVVEIDKLFDQITSASDTINQLKDNSGEISSITTVIESIAQQTNLLALNAAIEAARAGDQGRGFAVVADEVRSLAVRTQTSTTEIKEMIFKLQTGTETAVNIMHQSLAQTKFVVDSAKQSGASFETIASEVKQISTMCEQISAAAIEQEMVSDEISANISKINSMTIETAAGAEQISNISQELGTMTNQLDKIVSAYTV